MATAPAQPGLSPLPLTARARYCCPAHRSELCAQGDGLVGVACACRYPIVDGIPVLIPDAQERQRIVMGVDAQPQPEDGGGGSSNASFYNRAGVMEQYMSIDLAVDRRQIERWLQSLQIDGPVLEIGSGNGGLQGVGGDYVALDYSLLALRQFIWPQHQRVCASADRLPFFDAAFRMVFTVACLEHVPAADQAFAEIDRVLKPGGIAYVAPAWHCVQFICDGVPKRPYADLSPYNKFVKATLPIRRSRLVKAMSALPRRALRRIAWRLAGGRPSRFHFSRLRPDYETFWMSDSDACSRLDSHEGCLFFASRGYAVLAPGDGPMRQLTAGHGAVVVRKPG